MITQTRLKELLDYDPETGVFTWRVQTSNYIRIGDVAGMIDVHGYCVIGVDRKLYKAHRLAWVYTYSIIPDKMQIDHINGNTKDNRIDNLRCVTCVVNQQNQRKARCDNTSGFLGVHPYGKGWRARIMVNGKDKYLGTFPTPELAHEAYLKAKRELHEGNTL